MTEENPNTKTALSAREEGTKEYYKILYLKFHYRNIASHIFHPDTNLTNTHTQYMHIHICAPY